MRNMTPDHRRALFAHEYIKDLNGSAAARRMGIGASSSRSEASRMLAEPEVQELIQDLLKERKEAAKIDAEKVLADLAQLATFDPAAAYDPDSNQLLPIHEMPVHVRKAIAGVEVFEEFDGRGPERKHVGNTVKVKFADRGAYLERLMKHLGLLKEVVEVKGELTIAQRLATGRARTRAPDDGSDLAG